MTVPSFIVEYDPSSDFACPDKKLSDMIAGYIANVGTDPFTTANILMIYRLRLSVKRGEINCTIRYKNIDYSIQDNGNMSYEFWDSLDTNSDDQYLDTLLALSYD